MAEKNGRLAGKVAIVTGGTSGMGAGTVELFVAEGARVVIAARGEEAGQALANRLGENAIFKRTDVSVESDVKALIDTAVEKWGRLDVLFNNAGIGQGYMNVEEFTMDDFDTIFKVNLASLFLGIKYATPIMKQQGRGSIINNGSTAGVTADGSGPLYSATKAGVIHSTKVLAVELGEHGIRVNCISPGAIVTPIFWGGYHTQSAVGNELLTQRVKEFYDDSDVSHTGTPEDIAYAALYLASDESLHTTGLNMRVDAGLTCHNRPRKDLIDRIERRNKKIAGG